jgi:hypothetical protein
VNTGPRAITYDFSNVLNTPALGVHVSIQPGSVTVPAGSGETVEVTLSMSEAAARALPDTAPGHGPPLAVDRVGQLYTSITDVAGTIIATPRGAGSGIYPLRVPWMVIPRGISNVTPRTGTRTPWVKSGNVLTSTMNVRNLGVHAGIADVYSWGLTDGNEGMGSMDLRAGGVQSLPSNVCDGGAAPADRCLVFAVNTWQKWSTASENEFDVGIDVNNDRVVDYYVIGVDAGLVLDVFYGIPISLIVNAHTNEITNLYFASAGTNGSTLLLPVLASDIGLTPHGRHNLRYDVTSYAVADGSGSADQADLMTTGADPSNGNPRAAFNAFYPVVNNGAFVGVNPGADAKLRLALDWSRYHPRERGQLGWMIVSLDDREGAAQADLVSVGPVP